MGLDRYLHRSLRSTCNRRWDRMSVSERIRGDSKGRVLYGVGDE